MKKWPIFLLVAVVVGCGMYFWWGLTGVHALQEKSLKFGELSQVTMRDTISATGLVEPREIVFVSSESAGAIRSISKGASANVLRIGDTVAEGAVLAQIDDRRIVLKIEEANTGIKTAESAILQAEAALAQAEASKKAAEIFLTTQRALEKTGGFRAEREQAEAQVQAAGAGVKVARAGIEVVRAKKQAAQTALKEAELAREMTQIKVPGILRLPGVNVREFLVLDRKVNEGQMVGPQSGPLFTLAGSLDIVEVHAQVVEGDINKIREGLPALFKVKNYHDDESDFEGVIKRIRPLSIAIKGAVYYDAVIEVKNRKDPSTNDWQLRPGMTASLDIVRLEHKNVWRVPSAALNFKMDEAYLNDATKAKLAQWKQRADANDWRTLWVWDETARKPSPIFVRIDAKAGEVPLKDAEGNEILEWEPGQQPTRPLRIITDAPPARPPGFFDQPANVKI